MGRGWRRVADVAFTGCTGKSADRCLVPSGATCCLAAGGPALLLGGCGGSGWLWGVMPFLWGFWVTVRAVLFLWGFWVTVRAVLFLWGLWVTVRAVLFLWGFSVTVRAVLCLWVTVRAVLCLWGFWVTESSAVSVGVLGDCESCAVSAVLCL